MAHGKAKRTHARALTPAFPIYAILLQLRKTAVSSNVLRQSVTRWFYKPLCTTHHTALHPRVSFSPSRAVYAMMALRMHMPTKHQAGRGPDGLCRDRGSGDHAPAPAGSHDLSHPPTAVSARRRCFARSHRRTLLYPSRSARRCGARLGLDG